MFRHTMSVYENSIKMPKIRFFDEAKASILTCHLWNFNYFKIMVHILFEVRGVFAKDLEPMLIQFHFRFDDAPKSDLLHLNESA